MFTRIQADSIVRGRAGRMTLPGLLLAGMAGLSPAARSEVLKAEPAGFALRFAADIAAAPGEVFNGLVQGIGKWWHPAHTFSGDSGNLYIVPEAHGCFCERLPNGGSVRHLEVVFVAPGKMLRLQGGLGPLQGLAVAGSMSWQLNKSETGTRLELRYDVGGYLPDGLDAWARPVESVLDEQLGRLKAFVETGSPESPDAAGKGHEPGPDPEPEPAAEPESG